MIWKDSYWNGVLYILFFLLIGWGGILGFQKIDHGFQQVIRAQTSGDSGLGQCSQPQVVATMATPETAKEPSQATSANSQIGKKAVHAKDIIKGKTVIQAQRQGSAFASTQSLQVQQNAPSAKASDQQQGITVASLVERTGIGIGIFVKKETRNAVDGLVQFIEQSRIR